MTRRRPVQIALLGCGTVGSGVAQLLAVNAEALAARVGAPIEIRHILVRNPDAERPAACRPEWLTTDPERVLDDPELDVVVEVMGGLEPAQQYLSRAMASGKSVVSANKLLLAKAGSALLAQAREASVDLYFEAAVGGGIPVVRTLREALTGDTVASVHGILNGTCNYILTRMKREKLGFQEVLKDAQELGYAEANPSMDVDGHDAAQKLVIVSRLAFGAAVEEAEVSVEGIRSIDQLDFSFAERMNYSIKHLAIGRVRPGALELRVHPALVPSQSVLANINDALNGVYIHGHALGPCLLVGQGAGQMPTAVSVVSDLVDVARNRLAGGAGTATRLIEPKETAVLPVASVETRYYLRFDVADDPGVLGRVANALGAEKISVEQLVQEASPVGTDAAVSILMLTHRSSQGAVDRALATVAKQDFMRGAPRRIRIEDI